MKKNEAEFTDRNVCINCGSGKLKELAGGLFGDAPLRNFIENDPWGESPISYVANKIWSYVQCEHCKQMFHRFILSPEFSEILFTKWMTAEAIEKFEEQHKKPNQDFNKAQQYVLHILRLEKMTKNLRGNEDVRILDFGCGWGEFLAMCDSFGFESYGVDRSSARRKFGQKGSIFSELDELKKEINPSKKLHVITLFEVLEHVDFPLEILKSLNELLVPGGILILETPDCKGVTDIINPLTYRKIHPLSHINAFTHQTMQSIAKQAGFNPIKPSISYATSDRMKVIKTEVKQLINGFINPSTQQYFMKI
ncbi:MAG: class I SAM-dependent methyltransferase [Emcibacter sp.]|nr:class I SAM-dependent methyltransferase [Emcibacter sp.]